MQHSCVHSVLKSSFLIKCMSHDAEKAYNFSQNPTNQPLLFGEVVVKQTTIFSLYPAEICSTHSWVFSMWSLKTSSGTPSRLCWWNSRSSGLCFLIFSSILLVSKNIAALPNKKAKVTYFKDFCMANSRSSHDWTSCFPSLWKWIM